MSADRIEKQALLRAPLARVWRALSDSTEFGTWFGMKFDSAFRPGARVKGIMVPTAVNADVAKTQKPYERTPVEILIDQMEPERLFSFRWHPFAMERDVDYSNEPTTLVEFKLEQADGGVLLTVTESGFDAIPLARREKAFMAHEAGWGKVVDLIGRYVLDTA